jgi:hypothetical protein
VVRKQAIEKDQIQFLLADFNGFLREFYLRTLRHCRVIETN